MDDLTGVVEESCRHAARSWPPRITLNQKLCRAHGSQRLDSEAQNCLRCYQICLRIGVGNARGPIMAATVAFSDHVMHDYPSLIATA